MKKIVTKKTLDLYDKYDGDLGLLSERWVSKKDRQSIDSRQSQILSEYVDQLHYNNVHHTSEKLKNQIIKRIDELEEYIDNEVVSILKKRIQGKNKA